MTPEEEVREVAPGPDPEERGLILRAQGGDREAFGAVIRRNQRRVFALGFRFFGNEADADDLVQETFLRAWRSLGGFDAERPVAPWLLKIATNRALTELAKRKRHGEEELDETIRAEGPPPDEQIDRARLRERIGAAFGELEEAHRVILHLRVAEELSYREISDTLGIPIGTVMSRLARAREALRKRVGR